MRYSAHILNVICAVAMIVTVVVDTLWNRREEGVVKLGKVKRKRKDLD